MPNTYLFMIQNMLNCNVIGLHRLPGNGEYYREITLEMEELTVFRPLIGQLNIFIDFHCLMLKICPSLDYT